MEKLLFTSTATNITTTMSTTITISTTINTKQLSIECSK